MIYSTLVNNNEELQQILDLQQQNLPKSISAEELKLQGFVTFQHNLKTLQQFHELAPSIIVKDDEKVIGYALTVVNEARHIFPPMESLFKLLESLKWKNKPFHNYQHYEMGQVCVAKEYAARSVLPCRLRYEDAVYGVRRFAGQQYLVRSKRRAFRKRHRQ